MKTIDIKAKDWFDVTDGTSYFSARVTVDIGTENEKTYKLPFQYSDRRKSDYYVDMVKEKLHRCRLIKRIKCEHCGGPISIYQYCKENGIILRKRKYKQCLKKEVINYGK